MTDEKKAYLIISLYALLVLFLVVIAGTLAFAADTGEVANKWLDEILNMLGAEGLFAVAGSIAVMRTIRAGLYLSKTVSFVVAPLVSAVVGVASVYFLIDDATGKMIIGGGFITIIATMISYDAIKITLTLLFQWTKWRVFQYIFFFICPLPMKVKQGGKVIKVQQPSESLTKFMDWRNQEKTRIMSQTEKDESYGDSGITKEDITVRPKK